MKEKILITGSHGAIGSKVVERLEDQNIIIRGDRLCEFIPPVDRVIDLAAYGNTSGHKGSVYEIYRANVMRPISMLTDISEKKMSCKSILLTSSSSVLLEQQTPYSLSKKALEELALKLAEDWNLPIVIIRPSTVTGPGEAPNRLIPKLIDSCLNGTEMPFVSEPTHDYVFVQDVISAILLLSKIPIARGKIFNISSGITTSNEDVKKLVEKITKRKANIKMVTSLRSYDTDHWTVDNSDLRSLGWQPTYSLEEIIMGMLDDYSTKKAT